MNDAVLLGSKETPKGKFSFYCLTAPVGPEWKDKVEFFIQESKSDDWKEDIRHRLNGDYAADSLDRYFIAVDPEGELAAILWYGLSRKSGKGNFGHVFTAHRFRKLGLLKQLMDFFASDFHNSSGKVVCCFCTRPGPLKCYFAYDFEMILGDRSGPLALVRRGQDCKTFAELERLDYSDTAIAGIRPGTAGDQFDFDKFLCLTAAMRTAPAFCCSRGPMTMQYKEYRQAFLTTFRGGIVNVAENAAGHALGFAFLVPHDRNAAWLDFTVHPAAFPQSPLLLRRTAESFPGRVYAALSSAEREKMEILKLAGLAEESRLSRYYGEDDLVFLRFSRS